MSDGDFVPGMRLSLGALSGGGGFRSDVRFASPATLSVPEAESHTHSQSHAPAPAESEDPLAAAFAEGYAAGAADADARAAQQAAAGAAAREGLELAVARLDADLETELRQRLRDTVAALCETAIAPLALDEDALMRRIERAVSLLSRVDDERVIRLHPDDVTLLGPRFAADWQVLPDPSMTRGALRVETPTGGVEDGPDLWRRAIAEALRQC